MKHRCGKQVTDAIISMSVNWETPCDMCDLSPALCGMEIEQCQISGKPKTPEEIYLEQCHGENNWIFFIEPNPICPFCGKRAKHYGSDGIFSYYGHANGKTCKGLEKIK